MSILSKEEMLSYMGASAVLGVGLALILAKATNEEKKGENDLKTNLRDAVRKKVGKEISMHRRGTST